MKKIKISFIQAWDIMYKEGKIIKSCDFRYKVYSGKVMYFNPVIGTWQSCQFVTNKEMDNPWEVEEE